MKFTKTDQRLYIYKPKIKKNQIVKHQYLNTTQETKKIKIERPKQEKPGFEF